MPKPGFRSKNDMGNIYIYNKLMFRKKGETKWNKYDDIKKDYKDDDMIQIATASLDFSRTSYPIEVKWGEKFPDGTGGNGGGGGNNGNGSALQIFGATLLLCIILL